MLSVYVFEYQQVNLDSGAAVPCYKEQFKGGFQFIIHLCADLYTENTASNNLAISRRNCVQRLRRMEMPRSKPGSFQVFAAIRAWEGCRSTAITSAAHTPARDSHIAPSMAGSVSFVGESTAFRQGRRRKRRFFHQGAVIDRPPVRPAARRFQFPRPGGSHRPSGPTDR